MHCWTEAHFKLATGIISVPVQSYIDMGLEWKPLWFSSGLVNGCSVLIRSFWVKYEVSQRGIRRRGNLFRTEFSWYQHDVFPQFLVLHSMTIVVKNQMSTLCLPLWGTYNQADTHKLLDLNEEFTPFPTTSLMVRTSLGSREGPPSYPSSYINQHSMSPGFQLVANRLYTPRLCKKRQPLWQTKHTTPQAGYRERKYNIWTKKETK